jgi:hypothetical protein
MAWHLKADLNAAALRFVKTVRQELAVWVLLDDHQNPAGVPSNFAPEHPVVMMWSHRAYADRHRAGPWGGFEAVSFPIGHLLDVFLDRLDAAGALIGLDFNADLAGLEVAPWAIREAVLLEDPSENALLEILAA